MPTRPGPPDLFDDRHQLRDPWPRRIRARLEACGPVPFAGRCDRLARVLGAPDPLAIWALLMWNASVSPDLALRLRAWVRRGMPLPDEGAGRPDITPPLAPSPGRGRAPARPAARPPRPA